MTLLTIPPIASNRWSIKPTSAAALLYLTNAIADPKLRETDSLHRDSGQESTDFSTIELQDACEIEFWTRKFEVSREKLTEAVQVCGNSATAVEAWLSLHREPDVPVRRVGRLHH